MERCIEFTGNANEYEDFLGAVLRTHFRNVEAFVIRMLEIVENEEHRREIQAQLTSFRVGRIMTTDACMAVAERLHSEWGEAAFGEHRSKALAEEAQKALEHRVKAHKPENPYVRRRVLEMTGGRCAYCDAQLGGDFHIEHVVSKAAGGPDHLANYVPACGPCNSQKHTMHVLEFIKRYGGRR